MAMLLAGTLFFGVLAIAAPDHPALNWGSILNAGQCPQGKLVINVTYQVSSIDSGAGGNFWANIYPNRHLQVWQTGENTFYALVQDVGHFVTNEGRSPGNTDDIAAGIRGTYQGGISFTITNATLKSEPSYPSKGRFGPVSYLQPIGGVYGWMNEYFSTYSSHVDWWGWIYRTPRNGTWVNSSVNEGDITD
jgi:hypothetical protein